MVWIVKEWGVIQNKQPLQLHEARFVVLPDDTASYSARPQLYRSTPQERKVL
jgi:hypothetical protein